MMKKYYKLMKKFILPTILCLFSSPSWTQECIQGDCDNGEGIYKREDGSKYIGNFINGEFEDGSLWLLLSDEFHDGNESFYLKANSVEISGDYLYAVDLSDYKENIGPFNAKSVTNHVQIECSQSRAKPLNILAHKLSMAQGEILSSTRELDLEFDWTSFDENERGELYGGICGIADDYKTDPKPNVIFKEVNF